MLLDLLLPQRCVVCRDGQAQLCAACLEAVPRIGPPLCERCGAPTAWPVLRCRECTGRRLAFKRARSAVVYDDAVRTLVAAWKDRGLRRLARAAAALVAEVIPAPSAATLTYVAADPKRRRERGDHAAAALARELSARWDVPLLALLERRPGRPQRGLGRAERRANVRGAFSSRPAPRRVVLIDDVYTSGATANAAASALLKAGARRVDVVTFARVVSGYTVRSQARSPPRGGRVATSGEGPESRDQRLGAELRRTEAGEARPAARRQHPGRAGAHGREEPLDRGEPGGRGDCLDEGIRASRARGVERHARVDRPAHREAAPPRPPLPR